jgi:antitoxin CptB
MAADALEARATLPPGDDAPIGERALSKLRWRCRRGLLENDLFVERFFARNPVVTEAQARGLLDLMDLGDNDLLDLLLRRTEPDPGPEFAELRAVLHLMRTPAAPRNDPVHEPSKENA